MSRWAVAFVACLLAAGCESQPLSMGSTHAPSARSAGPASQLLVVLDRPQTDPNQPSPTSTLMLVTRQGKVVARVSFQAPARPRVGNAEPVVMKPVRVAAGAAYFVDSSGQIRRLDRSGKVETVTTLQLLEGRQFVSFAVSPDGAQVLASILTTPELHDPPPQSLGDPLFKAGSSWSYQFLAARPGSQPTAVISRDLGTGFPSHITEVAGWDQGGALATIDSQLGQQMMIVNDSYPGNLIHIASDGTHLDAVSGTDCQPVDHLPSGQTACVVGDYNSRHLEVRAADGHLLWAPPAPAAGSYVFPGAFLSPNGTRLATWDGKDLAVYSQAAAIASPARLSSTTPSLPYPEGWLDDSTFVLGDSGSLSSTSTSLAFGSLVNGSVQEQPFPVKGIFLGTV